LPKHRIQMRNARYAYRMHEFRGDGGARDALGEPRR